ncbi:MAG: hypothetical protein DRI57_30675 [Deltaproteobacteria bacterium]|nr:MAG: hypothetical protein DRI57_30675 [Deltaproteobacteria bacterium]
MKPGSIFALPFACWKKSRVSLSIILPQFSSFYEGYQFSLYKKDNFRLSYNFSDISKYKEELPCPNVRVVILLIFQLVSMIIPHITTYDD